MIQTLQLKVITALQDRLSAPLRRIAGASSQSGQQVLALQEKLKTLEQTQKGVAKFRELSRGLRTTGSKMQQAQDRVAALAGQMAQVEKPTRAMQREFKQAVAASSKLKQTHQSQVLQLQTLRTSLSAAGMSTRTLASGQIGLRGDIARTTAALKAQTAQLEQTEQRQRKLAAARESFNKNMVRTAAIGGAGMAARMTGMHVGRKMASLLHVGYEFEAQMSEVQGVTRIDDKNDPRMQALREQARTLPLSSKFTDLEVAQGQFFLGRTGYKPEEILPAMPHVLNLAAAGDMDLATTADIASNIQTAFDIPRDQMERVSDVLAAMFTRNNVDIQMLGQALKYSAVVGKEFGQSFESVTAATAMLGNSGIQADMAGTTMRQILLRIGNSQTMKDLRIQTHDENGNMRQLTDLLVDIGKVTGEKGNVLRGDIFKDIADQRSVAALSTLVAKAQTGELQEMIAVAHNAQGEAAALARKMTDNLKGDMSFLRAGMENISIELFEKSDGMLRRLTQIATNVLHRISEFLKKYPWVSKAIVTVGLAFAALMTVMGTITVALMTLLGPFLMFKFAAVVLGMRLFSLGGIVLRLAGTFRWLGASVKWLVATGLPKALLAARALGTRLMWLVHKVLPLLRRGLMLLARAFLMNPIGLAISAIAAAAYLIYRYWKPITGFFGRLWGKVKSIFDGNIATLGRLILDWNPLGIFYQTFAALLRWLGLDLPAKFSDVGAKFIDGMAQGIRDAGDRLKAAFTDILPDWLQWPNWMVRGDAWIKARLGFGPVQVDDRPPLTVADRYPARRLAAAHLAGLPARVQASDQIAITINAAPGMSERDIAAAVALELDKRKRQQQARQRSALWDWDTNYAF